MTENLPNVFLIQTAGEEIDEKSRKWHLPEAKRWCDEPIRLHTYIHGGLDRSPRDKCLTEAKPGDVALLYCNSYVAESPSQIKYACTITGVTTFRSKLQNRLLLDSRELQYGVTLEQIKRLLEEGKLSKQMNKCGKPGNIFKIEFSDYEAIVEESKKQPPMESERWLQNYIASKPLAESFPGIDFEDYELEGVEYPVENGSGRIDLLYKNPKSEYLVIELKVIDDQGAADQVRRYMRWIEKNKDATKVRGLVIGPNNAKMIRESARQKGVGFASFEKEPKFDLVSRP